MRDFSKCEVPGIVESKPSFIDRREEKPPVFSRILSAREEEKTEFLYVYTVEFLLSNWVNQNELAAIIRDGVAKLVDFCDTASF